MKKFLFFLLVPTFSLSIAIASTEEGKQIFENKCNKCHALERSLTISKDLETWKLTTLRMFRYSSGAITEKEAEEVAEYLAERGRSGKLVIPEKESDNKEKSIGEKGPFDFKKVKVEQFIKPEVCANCHSEIFKQWNGSMHSKAFVDPLWRTATKLFYKDVTTNDQMLEIKACIDCHPPLGFRSYSIMSPADDYSKLSYLPTQGIFCNWCHNISEVKHLGDAGYELEPGGGEDNPSTMLGPFKDADSPYHPTKYSELHTKSDFCGLCHNVSHAGNHMPIEQTYNEWKNSPYNTGKPGTTVYCQDCHMRQKPGIPSTGKTKRPDNPGKACDMGPVRQHIWTHYFVGGNAIVTKLLGSEMHAQMAVERLQNAADLELLQDSSYRKKGLSRVTATAINSRARHYLPTGLTEVRQMWLDVKITDAKGKILLRSGGLNEKGDIDKDAVIYHTKLGNEKGDLLNVVLADRVLYDHRIPPKGYMIESYAFYIPDDAVPPLNVEVSLKYRSASQELARILLGEKAPELPVIDMAHITEKIEFQK